MPRNNEGMTWREWKAAALQGGKHAETAVVLGWTVKSLQDAWRRGEDPTEYAAAFEKAEV